MKQKKFFSLLFALTSFVFCFAQPDVTPPSVLSVSPGNWSITINTGTTVSARLSEAMNASTINGTTFELRNTFNNALVAATVTYNASTKTAVLYPTRPLTTSLLYTAKVKGGSAGVKDLAGNAMANDYTWYFIMIPLVDLTAPTVLSVSPANGATGVSTSTTIAATLSELMMPSSVSASTVELRNASNVLIPATITHDVANRIITLTPSGPLANSATYTATIKGGSSGVKDASGNPLPNNYTWSFTTVGTGDVTPPTVTSVSPVNGTMGVSVGTVVSAIFSEAMNASTISNTTFQLRNAANTLITATVNYNAGTNTATLIPSAALASSTVYTATITGGASGVKDAAGNAMVNTYTWSFTTAAPADITPPTVTSVSPVNGATNVSVSSALSAIFSEAMNASTVSSTTFQLRNAANTLITATVTYNAGTNTVTLTPSAALASSTVYTATIAGGASGVKDAAGNAMVNNYTWSFTTADVIAPTVLSVLPVNGATAVSVSTTVSAIFSEAMNASTVSSTTFQLRNAANTLITATVTYNAGTNTATLTPLAALASSTVYTATITGGASGVKDAAGNAMANNYTWSFTTADVIAPTVLSVLPANGATGVSISTTVSAIFSEAMNASSISSTTCQLRNAANTLITATFTYNAGTNTATLIPSAALASSTLYTATITGGASGVKDAAGNAMVNNYAWSFTTAAAADITPPTVTSVSPANGITSVSVSATVSAIFSEAMNASTVSSTTFQLRNAASTIITATVAYNATTRTTTLTPSAALASSTVYTATIIGGASGVKDAAGNAMVNTYSWSFTTADIIPPTVTSVLPVNGATGVSVSATVSAVFSEAMNASTISSTTFQLRNAANTLITATVTYNATTKTATLTPSAALASSTVYTATITGGASGVKDAAGNALVSNYTWSFTTADIVPPTVLSVLPVNGATGISIGTTVSAIFSEVMNASTINSTTFQLRNAANTLITATVTYNAGTNTVTLTPSAALASSTVYTATITGGASGVKDAAGNAMVNNYTWSFTTVANAITGTIFQPTDVPVVVPATPDAAAEIGVRFRSTQNGFITGIRFYKGAGHTGTHIGHLWSSTGVKLGEATFTSESASGWQQVLFTTPVPIIANTTYVASYFSSAGYYCYTNNYFATAVVNGPLRALADGEDGSNGLYIYTGVSAFPTNSFLKSNYYADVVFTTSTGSDVTPPSVLSVTPANGATSVSLSTALSATFSEPLDPASINSSAFELRNSSGGLVAATISYNVALWTATLTPSSPLANSTTYTAKIKGGAAGAKDAAGNPLVNDYTWTFSTTDPPFLSPTEGPGGPILVISTSSNPFSRYAVEILRAEGLNEFAAADISAVTAAVLNNYDVVVLGEMTVTAAQVTLLTDWVNAGGTLVAFKPSSLLTPLLGISTASGTLLDKYLLVNTTSGPGVGIVNQTIQFHGVANLHTLSGATSLATLYSTASASTTNPAVTMRNVGANGGRAIAFTYDLAKSIIYTRQGNPAWAGQKRDGQIDPIRSDDMFFPDWVDFNKIAIPQADEQQRLLANIILQGNLHRKPLPRFWYLPRDLKAAIVMTGDDHTNGGTSARFNQYQALGPNTAQDVIDWRAVRGTSYVYPGTAIPNSGTYQAQGFEIALHPNTGCLNYTAASLLSDFTTQLAQFANSYPDVSSPVTNRTHCLAWSDWATQPKTELLKGMRLDVTYYYWPEVWMQNRPGMFTGSGMPMRFADVNGSLIDVYQAPTQMTDETNMNYTNFCNTVLDKALGAEGYYGVFTTNMHTDFNPSPGSDAIIASAQARQVPVISAKQMLNWLDGRNNSSFGNMTWTNNQLTFTATVRSSAANLKAMLPLYSESGQLISITRNGNTVPFTTQTIKGIQYAFFAPVTGANVYVATYAAQLTRAANPVTTKQEEKSVVTEDQKTAQVKVTETEQPSTGKLYVNVMPNPSINYFNLVISSNDANPVKVRIIDMFGRMVESYEKITSTGILRLGYTWRGGAYFAEVIQGDQKKVVKMIKTN